MKLGQNISYEVYALQDDGLYAAPEREASNPSNIDPDAPVPFDHRGVSKLNQWERISAGNITLSDLELDLMIVAQKQYFRIPFDNFERTRARVPPAGGRRSFYVTTTTSALLYTQPRPATPVPAEDSALNTAMVLAPARGMEVDPAVAPRLLVGEATASYPMPDLYLNYQARSFLGKIYYEMVCPSAPPSISGACYEG